MMATEKRLIDADALKLAIRDDYSITGSNYARVKRHINEAPTVNAVQVVHGRWEWITENIYRCTNCGDVSHVKEVMGQPDWYHCPCCGAKMDKSEKT